MRDTWMTPDDRLQSLTEDQSYSSPPVTFGRLRRSGYLIALPRTLIDKTDTSLSLPPLLPGSLLVTGCLESILWLLSPSLSPFRFGIGGARLPLAVTANHWQQIGTSPLPPVMFWRPQRFGWWIHCLGHWWTRHLSLPLILFLPLLGPHRSP